MSVLTSISKVLWFVIFYFDFKLNDNFSPDMDAEMVNFNVNTTRDLEVKVEAKEGGGPWILGGFCKVGVNLHFGRKSLIKVSQTHTQTHIHTYTHIDLQLWHVSFVWRSFTTDITIRVVFSKSFWNKKTNIFGNNWIIKKIIIYVTWVSSYLQKKVVLYDKNSILTKCLL